MALRFNTTRALFDTFPTARQEIGIEPCDTDPAARARALVTEGRVEQAASLCAYLLGRRDAVAWGCRSLRRVLGDEACNAKPTQRAAELWVDDPSETRKLAAQEIGNSADVNEPSTWLARAAGWSGGNISPSFPTPVPPHLTGASVRAAVIVALYTLKPSTKREKGGACVEDAIRVAERERQA